MAIRYEMAEPGRTRFDLYDGRGAFVKRIAEGYQSAGEHRLEFETGDLPVGRYLVVARIGNGLESRSVAVLR